MADIDEEAEEMLVEWFIILSGKVCIITSLEIFGNHEIKWDPFVILFKV